ncbi:MAG: phosphatase PAP2 family protein [Nitratireductor sp.]
MNERNNSTVIRRAQPPPQNWFHRVVSWFTFIHRRRLDTRFGVFPLTRLLVAALLAGAGILALFVFADAPYLAAVRSGATKGQAFFEMITYLGLSDWILWSSGAAFLLFSLRSADRFAGPLHRLWHRLMLTAYFLFTAVALSGLITNALKFIIGRARPDEVSGPGPWESVPFTSDYDYASFPSGHATTSGALTACLVLLFPRFRWLFIPLGLLVATSRNFIGVHFPSDVLAGLAVGTCFTWLWARAFARKRLLFRFTADGYLELRGEGRGHLQRWPELLGLSGKQ